MPSESTRLRAEVIAATGEEMRRGHVDGQGHVLTGNESGLLDRSTASANIASMLWNGGASPPSSAVKAREAVSLCGELNSGLVDGVAHRQPAIDRLADSSGTSSTSWMGTCPPACFPPLNRFIVIRGSEGDGVRTL